MDLDELIRWHAIAVDRWKSMNRVKQP